LRQDILTVMSHISMDAEREGFGMIRKRWSESLRQAFHELPDPDRLRSS
jgi:putative proteasome-type protease